MVYMSRKSRIEWHHYYRHYGASGEEYPLPVISITKILQFVEAAAHIFLGISCTDRELIRENRLNALDMNERKQKKESYGLVSVWKV